jgi:GMP synthase-like glutamine amidotransferase
MPPPRVGRGSLRLAVLQHEPETGLGAFTALLEDAGVVYETFATLDAPLPDADGFDGAIALGGSLNVYDTRLLETRRWIRNTVLRGLPFLGVCLGGQLLASALGAHVQRAERPELGVHDVVLTSAGEQDSLFTGLPVRLPVFGWHEDCFELPPGAVPLAGSTRCVHQAFRYGGAAYGLQFHPEVRPSDLTRWSDVAGYRMLMGGDAEALSERIAELARATPELDRLAEQLLERWLSIVVDVAAGARLAVAGQLTAIRLANHV